MNVWWDIIARDLMKDRHSRSSLLHKHGISNSQCRSFLIVKYLARPSKIDKFKSIDCQFILLLKNKPSIRWWSIIVRCGFKINETTSTARVTGDTIELEVWIGWDVKIDSTHSLVTDNGCRACTHIDNPILWIEERVGKFVAVVESRTSISTGNDGETPKQ